MVSSGEINKKSKASVLYIIDHSDKNNIYEN